jgi:initiation factor 1A
MPNVKGGKGYKKGSHETSKQPECDWDDGQQYGRVTRTLGNKRFRVLCNDSKERTCKLAGSLRKSQWCEEGTFVILSLRGISPGIHSSEEVGDILDVVEHSWVSKLKKDERINRILFGTDDKQTSKKEDDESEDDLFDEEESDSESETGSGSESQNENEQNGKTVEEREQEKKAKANAREKKNKERDQQRNARRNAKNDDIDIDAI